MNMNKPDLQTSHKHIYDPWQGRTGCTLNTYYSLDIRHCALLTSTYLLQSISFVGEEINVKRKTVEIRHAQACMQHMKGVSLCFLANHHTHTHTHLFIRYSTLPLHVRTCLDRRSGSQQSQMKDNWKMAGVRTNTHQTDSRAWRYMHMQLIRPAAQLEVLTT